MRRMYDVSQSIAVEISGWLMTSRRHDDATSSAYQRRITRTQPDRQTDRHGDGQPVCIAWYGSTT